MIAKNDFLMIEHQNCASIHFQMVCAFQDPIDTKLNEAKKSHDEEKLVEYFIF